MEKEKELWEKELEKYWEEEGNGQCPTIDEIISFIRQLLSQQETKIIEEFLSSEEGKVYQDYDALKNQIREEILGKLKGCLDYCQQHNGLSHCKNCGLSENTIKSIKG